MKRTTLCLPCKISACSPRFGGGGRTPNVLARRSRRGLCAVELRRAGVVGEAIQEDPVSADARVSRGQLDSDRPAESDAPTPQLSDPEDAVQCGVPSNRHSCAPRRRIHTGCVEPCLPEAQFKGCCVTR